jgi:hypothetical protein
LGTTGEFFFKKALLSCLGVWLHPWFGPQFVDVFFYLVNFGNVATKKGNFFNFLVKIRIFPPNIVEIPKKYEKCK